MTRKSGFGFFIYSTIGTGLAIYFAFAAVQGDLGMFQRIAVDAEREDLTVIRDDLQRQVDVMTNKTRRLSDTYLDLDLLDERARNVLGLMRSDDMLLR